MAWGLDDAEAVFSAREEAYRLYKESGDPASAARMATWLAADNLDFRGALSVARGWLRRAHRLLDPLDLGADHGWLAFQERYIANLGGDTDAARDLGERAAELGRRFGVADLEMAVREPGAPPTGQENAPSPWMRERRLSPGGLLRHVRFRSLAGYGVAIALGRERSHAASGLA